MEGLDPNIRVALTQPVVGVPMRAEARGRSEKSPIGPGAGTTAGAPPPPVPPFPGAVGLGGKAPGGGNA